jgi:antitoxin component YwqK of YwqJK toxin-antitoxin module
MVASLAVVLIATAKPPCTTADARPLVCPGGREPVRDKPQYGTSDYAIGCRDDQGRWDGPYQERRNDGCIAAVGQNRDGATVGTWTFFEPDETTRGTFRKGLREGVWTSTGADGKTLPPRTFKDNLPVGHWVNRYPSGRRESEGTYGPGRIETGLWTYWHENGQMMRRGRYSGTLTKPQHLALRPAESGKWTYWHSNGKKSAEGAYDAGVETGPWTYWYESGKPMRRGVYSGTCPAKSTGTRAAESGKWTTWYESGNKQSEGCYRNCDKVGTWTEWFEDGRVKSTQTFDASACP